MCTGRNSGKTHGFWNRKKEREQVFHNKLLQRLYICCQAKGNRWRQLAGVEKIVLKILAQKLKDNRIPLKSQILNIEPGQGQIEKSRVETEWHRDYDSEKSWAQ